MSINALIHISVIISISVSLSISFNVKSISNEMMGGLVGLSMGTIRGY